MDVKEGWCPDCNCMIPAMRWQGEIVFEEHAASDGPFLCEESLEPVRFKDTNGSVYVIAASVA